MEHQRIKRELGYRQFQILGKITERLEAGLRAPSLNMLADELGMEGTGNVCRTINALVRRGNLRRDDNRNLILP
jgi:SOS-response transcriptional repressor LexA